MQASEEMTRYTKTKDLLLSLISINSENPDMNPEGNGEAEIAQFIQDYLNKVGVETCAEEVLFNRPNIYGFIESEKNVKETVVFEVHTDTVPIHHCIGPKYESGVMYGRGACDNKGSLAAFLLALEDIAKVKKSLNVNVLFLATVDEEYKYRGVLKAIDYLKSKTDLTFVGAVVGEPTDLNVVVAHKSCLRWKVKVVGKSSHSGKPENGINAIYIMTELIQNIREKWGSEIERQYHPLLGKGTFNVGMIRGGEQVNIVPDYCEIVMERRLLPQEKEETILKSIDEEIVSLEKKYKGSTIIREEPFLTDYPLDTDVNEEIVQKMLRTIEKKIGTFSPVEGVQYGTDASKISKLAHVPSIVFGPGDIAFAHTENEQIIVEDVVTAKEIYEQLILNW